MAPLAPDDVIRLERIANRLRQHIIETLYPVQGGHPGGALSLVEILTVLYFHHLRLDPRNPAWAERDRLVLSKGHGCVALYAALAERGFFPVEMLATFDRVDSMLQGHPDRVRTPGVEISTGTLGQGLSAGIGMALGNRLDGRPGRVYVVMGDGELQEGQVWEAAMAAAHYRLDALAAIVDRNCLQIHGSTEDIMPLEPLATRFRAFGWHVTETDGHDLRGLQACLEEAGHTRGRPTLIVAHTVKGKGISFMENRAEWHSRPLQAAEYEQALQELRRDAGAGLVAARAAAFAGRP